MEDSMELYATVVYVVSSELLKILGVQDDIQAKMENAEVMRPEIASFTTGSAILVDDGWLSN